MLEVEGLTVAYGRTVAVHALDLHVTEAQVVALIGANGAGKTTTLRALSCARARGGCSSMDAMSRGGRGIGSRRSGCGWCRKDGRSSPS
jgi:ABC-type branched-subunit amino acid transport system ATPase component